MHHNVNTRVCDRKREIPWWCVLNEHSYTRLYHITATLIEFEYIVNHRILANVFGINWTFFNSDRVFSVSLYSYFGYLPHSRLNKKNEWKITKKHSNFTISVPIISEVIIWDVETLCHILCNKIRRKKEHLLPASVDVQKYTFS